MSGSKPSSSDRFAVFCREWARQSEAVVAAEQAKEFAERHLQVCTKQRDDELGKLEACMREVPRRFAEITVNGEKKVVIVERRTGTHGGVTASIADVEVAE